MHDQKQGDYGKGDDPFANVRKSADMGIPGWCGAVLRMNDKQVRLQKAVLDTITEGAPNLKNEGVKDTLMDMAVYALIAYVLFEDWDDAAEPVSMAEVWNTPIIEVHDEVVINFPGRENVELVKIIEQMLSYWNEVKEPVFIVSQKIRDGETLTLAEYQLAAAASMWVPWDQRPLSEALDAA